ncbi:Ala-tRNA(Pro) deacylase [Alkalibaculum bacchi]|jgi:Ala-tRNA(Pro) deacylase|uniref:Ala-tRNA(Pro) deacylase n=1 Tax=Alkalibaculum bacchi TaxID=645887 RepID=A0A366I455_9FIRM|nr:prolyl-tRNA synthetase associated domain-containing protein [Alkalibaculum bacchi]RBP61334.1 Ala-tRNA(Pro) deacylase [Alkalibaculum bacchi]
MTKESALFNIKPNCSNRLQKEIETYDLLNKLNIPFAGIDHQAAMTIEDLGDTESLLGISIAKNLFLRNSSKSKFYLLVMPGHKKFLTKNLSKQIESSRLSFADGSYMEEYLNITPGSCSILGLMFDKEHKVNLVIDKDIIDSEYLGCHPCVNTSSLKIKTSDIMEVFLPHTGHEAAIVEL